MSKLIITKQSRIWGDGAHREDGHFDPIALTLEDAIDVCLSQGNPESDISVVKNDERRTLIIRLNYKDKKLMNSSKPLTDELKKIKVKFWCSSGDWLYMGFNLFQVNDDLEELVDYVSIEELESMYQQS
jgi:hypothetical protein